MKALFIDPFKQTIESVFILDINIEGYTPLHILLESEEIELAFVIAKDGGTGDVFFQRSGSIEVSDSPAAF